VPVFQYYIRPARKNRVVLVGYIVVMGLHQYDYA
jgi:hypothetical protein